MQTQLNAEQIAQRYPNAKRTGDGWLIPCPCPGHVDTDPSCSIKDTEDGVRVHCFAGCDYKDVKEALGLTYKRQSKDEWLATCLVATYQHADGRARKRYRRDYPADFPTGDCTWRDCTKIEAHKHIWGTKGASTAGCFLLAWGEDAPDKVLVLVEGEKAAAALLVHVDGKDYTPVTWNGGSSVDKSDFALMDGRTVILWPDNDAAGLRAMRKAARACEDAGATRVSIVDVQGLNDKADAADVDAARAAALLESATECEIPAHGGRREGAGHPEREVSDGFVNYTERGLPLRSSVSNMLAVLHGFDDVKFEYDQFADREIANSVEVLDVDAVKLKARSERERDFSPATDALYGAISLKTRQAEFHPVRDYLHSLEWDKKLRLSTLGERYFGTAPTPLQNAIARLIIQGAVARVLTPGCKFDYLPVIQSQRQGMAKSQALEILGGEWAGTGLPLDSFDLNKMILERSRGVWIWEIPDLAGWKGSDIEKVKSVVSMTTDSARMAYGRKSVTRERQFVMVATANPTEFLKDSQNRRFPVLEVKNTIDLDALSRDRNQLFAEAKAGAEKMGAHVTLPEALWQEAEMHSQQFRVVSDFEEAAVDYLSCRDYPAQVNMVDMIMALPTVDGSRVANQEKGRVMAAAGYRRRRVNVDGDKVSRWVRE